VLDGLLIVIVPLMNPDGRAAAIREWQVAPRATGHQGSGNAYGVPINRDFFNLSQPEARAVRGAINRFHPVAAYDPHEDMYHLGDTLPYACWTPPFARPYHPDIDPRVIDCIGRLGGAIAEEWRRRGYNFLYHPNGEHDFLTLFRLGGRFHLHLCLQGVPALITESARMPGAQTWEDRVEQKVSAGLAFLGEIAAHAPTYLAARYAVRSDLGPEDAFLFPRRSNSEGALAAVLDPLLRHEVQVYETSAPEPAVVVPTHQPDGRLVRALLDAVPWNHVALPPLAGATCFRLSALSQNEQSAWRRAALARVVDAPSGRPRGQARPGERARAALPNEPEGAAAANRLIALGAQVWRLPDGRFGVDAHPRGLLERAAAWDLAVPAPDAGPGHDRLLRRPRIALYAGQGVDQRHQVLLGGTRAALERLGFPYVPVVAGDVRDGELSEFEMLIVPGGWAAEIVHGWDDPGPRWQMPGRRDGLGDAGLDAVRIFVERGGRMLGIGSGGGVLASGEFLGLVDAALVDEMIGETRSVVQIVRDHPLVVGMPARTNDPGRPAPTRFAAPYYSEPFAALHGGPILRAGPAAHVLAEYAAVDDPAAVRAPHWLEASSHTPAVLFQPYGRGWAAVLAFEPYLRCVWRSTLPLLANAVFFAGEPESRAP
jgi:hypothetical protein